MSFGKQNEKMGKLFETFEKRPLMVANKDHIHHFLESLGLSKKLVLALLVLLGFFCLFIGYLIEDEFSTLSFSVFLILFFIYLFIRLYFNFKEKAMPS